MNRPSAVPRRVRDLVRRPAGKTPRRGGARARPAVDGPAIDLPAINPTAIDRPETLARLAALAAQNTLYATAIEQIALGLCMFDAQDRLVVANRQMSR